MDFLFANYSGLNEPSIDVSVFEGIERMASFNAAEGKIVALSVDYMRTWKKIVLDSSSEHGGRKVVKAL